MLLLQKNPLYLQTASTFSLSPTAFWPFGDAHDAATLTDSTGRGNSLTPYLRIVPTTVRFRMGRNGAISMAGQQVFGSMKGWGRWNRILSSGEKAALYGKEYWPFSTTTSLQDTSAYYLLDESGGSATYVDSVGGNNLSATGTTTQVTGPAGGTDKATNLVSGVYLSKEVPTSAVQSSQISTTVAGWVNLDSKPAGGFSQQVFWGQLVNETPSSGLNVYYDPTADRFALDNDGGDGQILNKGAFVLANTFGAPSIGSWYFLIAEFDVSNNQLTISVNNGAQDVLPDILQPVPTTGKVGNGSLFELNPTGSFSTRTSGWDADGYGAVAGNSRVSRAVNADVSIGDNAKTVWGWFKATDTSTLQVIAGFTDLTGTNTDWFFKIDSGVLSFVFGLQMVTVSVPFTDTSSFHLVVAWFDKANNVVHIDLDHSTRTNSATGPATPHAVSNSLIFGSGINYQFKGVLNAWGIADGNPSYADLDYLWNSGNGVSI